MSFNISDSSRITKDKSVICNYYDCSIYLNQYERTPNNGGYIKIPFFTPENIVRPNAFFISGEPTIKYISNSLQIYKKTHNINDIDYDGELVIENNQITNGDTKIYICFPLKTYPNQKPNEIDNIIKKSEVMNSGELSMTINLNKMFDKLQKYIFYKSGNNIVVVFTQPIKVQSSFDKKYVECSLFSKFENNYNILQNAPGKEGMQNIVEGYEELDCQPIDIETGEIVKEAPYLTFLKTGSDSQNKTVNLMFSMLIFVIIFCVAFFGAPAAYKQIFINIKADGGLEDTDLTYTVVFCVFYLLWCIGMGVGAIWDTGAGITAVTFLILFGMSVLTIYGRTYFDKEYFDKVAFNFDFKKIKGIVIFVFVYYIFNDFFGNIRKNWQYKYGHIFAICSIILSSCLLFYLYQFTDPVNKRANRKNKLGRKVPDKTRQKYKDYRDYATAMISIFGFGYAIFVVGPFIGRITGRT
jgi:DNA-binding cell septation regulator SpoVG